MLATSATEMASSGRLSNDLHVKSKNDNKISSCRLNVTFLNDRLKKNIKKSVKRRRGVMYLGAFDVTAQEEKGERGRRERSSSSRRRKRTRGWWRRRSKRR